MQKCSYRMQILSGEEVTVQAEVIYAPQAIKPFGFYAEMLGADGRMMDSALAPALFMTEEEAAAQMELLEKYQVTPGTLIHIFE